MLGENLLIFALDPKLEFDTENHVLHSGPKFSCFVVHFCKYFWFWYQTEIVSEKVYSVIWPVLEITSLNWGFQITYSLFQHSGWEMPKCQSLKSEKMSKQGVFYYTNHHNSDFIFGLQTYFMEKKSNWRCIEDYSFWN